MAKNRFRQNVSIWIIISVIVALAVTLAFMASTHLRRQQQQAVEMMTDKGATLINTFAAALRNPAYFKGDFFSLQKLVMETARQPDIDYIIVTEGSGNIIADSDPSSIGDRYGMDLDIGRIASSDEIRWRQVANTGGADTFEVYRGIFLSPEKTRPDIDSRRPGKNPAADNLIIYTGFNMEAIDKATSADATNTIIIALILSLIGSSVIVSLFLAQAWRQASSSLSRITVFSETLVKNMPIGLIAEDVVAREERALGSPLRPETAAVAEDDIPANIECALPYPQGDCVSREYVVVDVRSVCLQAVETDLVVPEQRSPNVPSGLELDKRQRRSIAYQPARVDRNVTPRGRILDDCPVSVKHAIDRRQGRMRVPLERCSGARHADSSHSQRPRGVHPHEILPTTLDSREIRPVLPDDGQPDSPL